MIIMRGFKKFAMYDKNVGREYSDCVPDRPNKVVVDVDDVQHFILRTKDKDYNLDFQRLLRDYGVEKYRGF